MFVMEVLLQWQPHRLQIARSLEDAPLMLAFHQSELILTLS
jgi:hypothetical protein